MQSIPTQPQTWTGLLWFIVANIITSGSVGLIILAIVKGVLKRKRPLAIAAELHESQARAAKDSADARSIELKSNISAGDAVVRWIHRMEFAQIANDKLHEENERLRNENDAYERQIQWAKGVFKMKGIQWEDHIDRSESAG
jgi:hypothetical protein